MIQQQLQQQLRLMELLTERLSTSLQTSQKIKLCTPGDKELVVLFITDVETIFPKKFARYEDLFTVNSKEQVDDLKVRLLLRKLGSAEHDWYSNNILSKHPQDNNFAGTAEILKQTFGKCTSLFNIRFNCLKHYKM